MNWESIIQGTLLLTAVYLLASSAGLISEKSGVANISLEGSMVFGATLYHIFMDGLGLRDSMGVISPFVVMLLAGLLGSLLGLLFSIAVVTFMADQIIAGTVINLLAPALFSILALVTFGTAGQMPPSVGIDSMLNWYSAYMFIFVVVIAIIIWFVLNKTSVGLRLRTAGENPYSLETAGVSVNKTRYVVLIVAGMMAAMAGAMLRMQLGQGIFIGTVYGAGFIAIAIMILGQYKIEGAFVGSFLVAFVLTLIQEARLTNNIILDYYNLFLIIPFALPILVMIIAKKTNTPKYLGKPFNKSNRE